MDVDSPSSRLTLDRLVADQASRRPDAPALTDGAARLTWREYRDEAFGLAGAIRAAGARPGDRVAVVLPKSAASFVAVHAVLAAGCTMVPVDWFAPASYADGVLADAGVRVAITTGTRVEHLAASTRIATVDVAGRDTPPPPPDVRPGDPAYLIYTSGSTGRPKGILHTHASALAYATRAVETYGLGPDDRLANVAPLHFDQSTFELYAAPLAGAAAIVVPDAVLRFPASTGALIAEERATVWYSVPYAITQLVERGAPADRDLSSLRWVLFGGESFPVADLRAAMARLPGTRFSNVYGPAEVNQCTFHHLDRSDQVDEPIPIGRPWRGIELAIVDRTGGPVDDGDTGELLVGGDTMMDGYWERPDLTAAAIDVDAAGRRWYRTGDLAYQRPDGAYVFVGRADHQVKVRGHRVELEAVELAIAARTDVDACAVVVDGDRLVAIVQPPMDDAAVRALLSGLRETLPRYAVPATVVGVDRMPRTGTGKIDRRAAADAL